MQEDNNNNNDEVFTDTIAQSETPAPEPALEPEPAPVPEPAPTPTPEFAPTPEPAPTIQTDTVQQPIVQAKKSNKMLFIIIAIAAFLVVVIGAIAGYLSWYQSPEKVLSDAVSNAVNAKYATYATTIPVNALSASGVSVSSDGNISLTFKYAKDSSAVAFDANIDAKIDDENSIKLKANVIIDDKKDIYVKLSDTDDLATYLKSYLSSMTYGSGSSSVIDDIVDGAIKKIDGQWIKFSDDSISKYSSDTDDTKTCLEKVVNKYGSDSKTISEIAKIYENNKFIKVDEKLAQKDGSFGYKISIDRSKSKGFGTGVEDTELFKALEKCGDSSNSSSDYEYYEDTEQEQEIDPDDYTFEVWVDSWSHKFTKFSITYKDSNNEKSTISIAPDYKTAVSIKTPSDSKDIDDLVSDIQEIFTEIEMNGSSSIDISSSDCENNECYTINSNISKLLNSNILNSLK